MERRYIKRLYLLFNSLYWCDAYIWRSSIRIQHNAQIESNPIIVDWPDENYLIKQTFLPINPVM